MNEEKRLLTAFNSSRMVENDFAFNVSKTQKIESPPHSFFFDVFRSKVIFRVTQKSLRILLSSFRKHLALAGGSAPISILMMVACLMELWSNPSLYLPVVAFVAARPSVNAHSDFHASKNKCYGKKKG